MEKIFLKLQLFGGESEETDITDASGDGVTVSSSEDTAECELTEQSAAVSESEEECVREEDPEEEKFGIPEKQEKTAGSILFCERIISEADMLSEKVDGFDLRKELENKSFLSMLKSGVSVETAYRAIHFDELLGAVVKEAKETAWREALSKMKLGRERPTENGAVGQAAVQSRAGVENLTGRGIREILRRVENGAKIKF